MQMAIAFLFSLLGLCFGSFFNVLIDRIPLGESPFAGRSHCDFCKKKLSLLDLFPVISFLVIGGKCRYCRKKLSLQYPVIELITGIIFFVLSYIHFVSIDLIYDPRIFFAFVGQIIVISSALIMFMTDFKYMIIPDEGIIAHFIGALIIVIAQKLVFTSHLLSGIGFLAFFLFIFIITNQRGIGFGDVKLSFSLGFLAGFPNVIVVGYAAFLTGAVVSLILILLRKASFKKRIAFGPFLLFGSLVSGVFGAQIVQWYMQYFL